MTPLTSVLNKGKNDYNLDRDTTLNHLMFMDDIKIFGRIKEDTDCMVQAIRVLFSDIRSELGIENC